MLKLTKNQKFYTCLAVLALVLFSLWSYREPFSLKEKEFGDKALKDLEQLISQNGNIPEISEEELEAKTKEDKVAIVRDSNSSSSKEGYSSPFNKNFWQRNYYSSYYPYYYPYSLGGWPPGLYNRMYNWSPTFYTGSGWTHYLRPGYNYMTYPHNRWYRRTHNGNTSYYYVNNK